MIAVKRSRGRFRKYVPSSGKRVSARKIKKAGENARQMPDALQLTLTSKMS